jgi:formylglycine-generating enzyme required for sulfatase activity
LIPDHLDSDSLDPRLCTDIDDDTCDDCALSTWNPANDGTDSDGDGICDQGDYCVHVLVGTTWEQTTDCRVLIPAGYFTYGDDSFQQDLELEDFYMDVFPVTAGQFSECVASGPCTYNGSPGIYHTYHKSGYQEHPINYISHPEAAAYCAWKNGRLPTEEEWEKAARGEDGPSYPWGETLYSTRANYNGSNDPFDPGTTPVGYYDGINTLTDGTFTLNSPSDYGLYDMSGNVWEWTSTQDGSYYIVRGGSFLDSKNSYSLKTYGYTLATSSDRYGNVGFRCAE